MNPIVVIPSRLAATRLPGKPLAEIAGVPMIVQVWRRAREAGLGPVIVAAGDREIVEAVTVAGGTAVLTDPDHPSGSDRIFEAVERIDPGGRYDVVVNVQCDLPTLDHAVLRAALAGGGGGGEWGGAVTGGGGAAVLTDPDHPSVSDRIFEAVGRIDPGGRYDVVVKVQGDLPTIDPAVIRAALAPLEDPAVDIATLAAVIVREEEIAAPSVVKAVVELPGGATVGRELDFTRATAPPGHGPRLYPLGKAGRAAGRGRGGE